MKRQFIFFQLLRGFSLLVMMYSSSCIFSQSGYVIQKSTVNVRSIVDMKLQHPLSEQINNSRLMPEEHEGLMKHTPATEHIHYAKEDKIQGQTKILGQPSPAAQIGFAARSFDTNYPPDPHGAVNENFVVSTVNNELHIQDRSGTLISDVYLTSFWAPLQASYLIYDPRLVYDPNTRTWFIVTAEYPGESISTILVGVSQTDDPTGNWNIYQIKADATGLLWADYPSIAYNKNWVAITVNLFGLTSDGSDTGRIYLLNRSDLVSGVTTPRLKVFNVDQGVSPAVTYDSTMDDLYLLETYYEPAGELQLLKVTGAIGSEQVVSVAYPAIHMTWSPAGPDEGKDFAPQLKDTNRIQCNDDRMGSVIFKNNAIWGTHTVFLPADTAPTRSSVLWWEIDTSGDVIQYGLIDDPSGKNFYAFPSIAVNKYNDALIGYSAFSAQQYASAGYSYHDHEQAPGSVNDPYIFKTGDTTYFRAGDGRNRWGDCSATVVDPLNDVDFWTINEYAYSVVNDWGTWWASVGGLDTINRSVPASFGADLVPNPNKGTFNLYFTEQVTTPVQIDIYDMLGARLYTTTDPDAMLNSAWVGDFYGYLADGIYVVRIKANSQTIDKKMLVHH